MADATLKTYTNPVYRDSFPDPFVLRSGKEFFAFCTGHAKDRRIFGVLRSDDLVTWEELPGAMEPLPPGLAAGDLYWAPEVTYFNGLFHLYYSVGNETLMQIRVATSREPNGPYVDTGHKLTRQDFAIDPHVFIDDDSSWHMFYATDFLDHSHIGTGTVVEGMIDPFRLAGNPRPVTRAKYDWQVYDPARKEKGGVKWHTVEGPFVLKRKSTYFEMFSGGNWQNITYGVGYAVSDSLESGEEWTQQVDGTETLPLLHTIPGKAVGPGHNSVVTGPNGRQLFCVYHRWENDKRVMCIDRMDFAGGDRLFVAGPTFEPQPAPFLSTSAGFEETFADGDLVARGWSVTDDCVEVAGCNLLVMSGGAPAALARAVRSGPFEFAINFRLDDVADSPSIAFGCGVAAVLKKSDDNWRLEVDNNSVVLPADFSPSIFHQFRILTEGGRAVISLDGVAIDSPPVSGPGDRVEVVIEHSTAVLDMVRYSLL